MCHFTTTANIDPTRRYLYFQIVGGKAFLEHLQEPEALPGQTTATFTVHMHFRGQRFRSRPVPCACEPDFQEGFLLEMHKWSGGKKSVSNQQSDVSMLQSSGNICILQMVNKYNQVFPTELPFRFQLMSVKPYGIFKIQHEWAITLQGMFIRMP